MDPEVEEETDQLALIQMRVVHRNTGTYSSDDAVGDPIIHTFGDANPMDNTTIPLPKSCLLYTALLPYENKGREMDEVDKTIGEPQEIGIHDDSSDDGPQTVGNEDTESTEKTGDTLILSRYIMSSSPPWIATSDRQPCGSCSTTGSA